MKLPELLAPAGGMEALRAGVENGADAVYLGGQVFSARANASNFSRGELGQAIEYAHLRGVKVYVTVNILIDNSEVRELVDYVHMLYTLGADAVILQDLGVAYLLRQVLPELPVHASTQMTIVNSPGVKFSQRLGFERTVLARETSLKDMAAIFSETGADLEVFVHGALCVCYSGQCLMSSMIGGRSGNRGRCAQPCRMNYELVDRASSGKGLGLEVGEHLLSPRDLNLLDYLGELAQAGISSLKVEGRMKRAEYVATVIRNYRGVLDRLGEHGGKGSPKEHKELAQIFNRDFTPGYLLGYPGLDLMSYKRPNNRGVLLGRVVQYDRTKGRILLKLEAELNAGDGIEIWIKKGREGVYVHRIWEDGAEVETASAGSQVWIEFPGQVSTGDRIFKTHDEKLVNKARLSYQEGKGERRIPLNFHVSGKLGERLRIFVSDPDGNSGAGETDLLLEQALKRPLTEEYLVQQLDRLGNTPFSLAKLELDLEGSLIVPVREINEARRKAIEMLTGSRLGIRAIVTRENVEQRFRKFSGDKRPAHKTHTKLSVAVGDLDSLHKGVDAGADIIYFGGDHFRSKQAMGQDELARGVDYCLRKGVKPVVRLPRLVQEHRLESLERHLQWAGQAGAKAVQASDLGGLAFALEHAKLEVQADYPLNAFNDLTLKALDQYGVKMITLSPELTFEQLGSLELLQSYPCELIVHGALPLMVTEYCAMGSLLGGGKREGCSQPCRHKLYGLKDRMNFVFPLETDQNCRMHVFNAKELNLIEHLLQTVKLGAEALRLELKKDSANYVEKVTRAYNKELQRVLADPKGYRPDRSNIEELTSLRPGGYTKGHYFRGVM